jgi:uncharacterized protein YcbX
MSRIGWIKEIWRYPVKGMAGEMLTSSGIDGDGLTGDRKWAVRETARSEIQSCKRHPSLLMCTARYNEDPQRGTVGQVRIRLPDGDAVHSDSPDVHARLAQLTGVDVTLEPLRPASDIDFYRRYNAGGDQWLKDLVATFTREPGEPLPDLRQMPPEMIEFVTGAPGSFHLVSPLHLITTASIRQLRTWNGDSDWNARRFRPNLVIETEPGLEGLVEQQWIGKRLSVADTALDCIDTTLRCGAITRSQEGLRFDKSILRTVVRQADQNVGVYCRIPSAGTVNVGDAVMLA